MENGQPLDYTAWRRLIGSVLLLALIDAQGGDSTASAWLLADGLTYLEALGIDLPPERWKAFVEAGCPGEISLHKKKPGPKKAHTGTQE